MSDDRGFRIEGLSYSGGRVFVGGRELSDQTVRGVVKFGVGEIPTLHLELIAPTVSSITGGGDLEITVGGETFTSEDVDTMRRAGLFDLANRVVAAFRLPW